MAALMLPFYRATGRRPQFTHSQLPPPGSHSTNEVDSVLIRQYVDDMPYFMTLSMHPWGLGSAVRSIFWFSDIE